MKILVRILGGIFPVFSAFACIYFGRNIDLARRYYIFYGFAIGGIGYTFFPKNSIDYVRYLEQINHIATSGSLLDVFVADTEKLYFRDILFYVIGQVNNEQLLAIIVATFTYSVVAYIFFDIISNVNKNAKNKISSGMAIIVFIISISTVSIFTVISLTRNVLCFSAMFLGMYFEFVKQKKVLPWGIYISMMFFHHSALIFIIARMLVYFVRINILYLAAPLIFISILYFLSIVIDIRSADANFLLIVIRRILSYWENNTQGWGREMFKYYSETFDFFYQVMFELIVTGLLLRIKNKNNKILIFFFIINLIAISTIFINPGVFSRFVALQSLFFVVVYVQLKIDGFDRVSVFAFNILCCMSLLKIISNIICYINFVDTSKIFEKYLLGGMVFM